MVYSGGDQDLKWCSASLPGCSVLKTPPSCVGLNWELRFCVWRGTRSAPVTGGCSEQTCTGDECPCLRSLTPPISPRTGRKGGHSQLQKSPSSQEFMASGANSPKKALKPQRREGLMLLSLGLAGAANDNGPISAGGPSGTGTQTSSSTSRHGFHWACSLLSSPATPSICTLMCYCWHHPLSCRIKKTAAFSLVLLQV